MRKKNIILFVSLGIVLGLNLYLRSFPIYFPQLKVQAAKIMDDSIRQKAIQDVQSMFPQFYPTAKDAILKSRIAEYKKANKGIFKAQTNDIYKKLKDRFQDETGQTYLMELDCWHWGRYVKNVVKFGHPGDEIISGKQWDRLSLAPLGMFMHWEGALFYYAAYPYKLFNLIKPTPLFHFLFYFPLAVAGLFIAVLFFFTYRQSGWLGASVTSVFIGVSPMFMMRSCAGWFDKDVFTLLFPVAIIWTYITGRTTPQFRLRLIYLFASAILLGLFCATWIFWWFILLILLGYESVVFVYNVVSVFFLKKGGPSQLKEQFMYASGFVFFGVIAVLVFSGAQPLEWFYRQVVVAVVLNKPLVNSVWPNVLYTVGELRRMNIHDMINSLGGPWLAIPAFLSMIALLIRALFRRPYDAAKHAYIMIFFLWFISMVFASSRGVRFAVFLLVPLGISLGWGIDELYRYFRGKKNIPAVCGVIILASALCVPMIRNSNRAASNIYPLMDDTWYGVLNQIKTNTSSDTIINSWWDFGDWFKAVADRRVIFDGQSQDKPQAYWMAKSMLTNNEEQSIAILRMLNNGGNKAFELIDERLKNPLVSVLLLESVLGLSPDRAAEILLKFLTPITTEDVMKILYSVPSKAGFIVDYSMLPKMTAISYLGNWDFSKVYIAQNFGKMESDRILDYLVSLGKNAQNVRTYYQEVSLISTSKLDDWLSHRLMFYSAVMKGREKDDVVYFDNGSVYKVKSGELSSSTGQVPISLFVAEQDGEINETIYASPNVGYSILLYKDDSGYKAVMLDRELGASVFARLYLLKGISLRHFSLRLDAEEGGNAIRYFDIIW